jgi:DNA topoisomerase VI subunit B
MGGVRLPQPRIIGAVARMNGDDIDQTLLLGTRVVFEPAQNPPHGSPQFLQKVAKSGQSARCSPWAQDPGAKLTRVAFRVSRLMEFCSIRELQNQTGHSVREWSLVIVKESMDNALDAAEEAEVAPEITVVVDSDSIVIEDNACGIAAETIEGVLDYTVRVSSREAYVSPTRGAQGNALKTILAMGYVLDRESGSDGAGVTIIESRGVLHRIEFRVDHVNNQPKIFHTRAPSPVETGTRFTIRWPATADYLLQNAASGFNELVEAYSWLNPHLTLRGVWLGRDFVNMRATNPDWEKWRPCNPTSPHWYDQARLQRYMAAHVARDRDLGQERTVRAFVGEFRGLSSTAIQRKILTEVGCSHQSLASFFGSERVNHVGIARLLEAMRARSKPVDPKLLGVIGREHFQQRFLAAGGNAETFKYERRKGSADGIPYVFEFAFGLHQSGLSGDRGVTRKIVTGANWSPAIANPFRRFGSTGEGLDTILAKVRATASQPVICGLHLASAHIQYADRGKSSIILTDDAEQPDD